MRTVCSRAQLVVVPRASRRGARGSGGGTATGSVQRLQGFRTGAGVERPPNQGGRRSATSVGATTAPQLGQDITKFEALTRLYGIECTYIRGTVRLYHGIYTRNEFQELCMLHVPPHGSLCTRAVSEQLHRALGSAQLTSSSFLRSTSEHRYRHLQVRGLRAENAPERFTQGKSQHACGGPAGAR